MNGIAVMTRASDRPGRPEQHEALATGRAQRQDIKSFDQAA